MTVSISPAQPKDAVHIAALNAQAFSSNILMRAIYPTPAIWKAFQGYFEQKCLADMQDVKTTVLIARYIDDAEVEDAPGKIIGYAVWHHPVRAKEKDWNPPTSRLPEGTDWSVLRPWLAAAEQIAEEVVGDTPHYGW
jgi:hypothetical protein